MNKILLTGATGNIGSQMVKILKEKKIPFTAGITASGKSPADTDHVVIDFSNKARLVEAFTGFDTVFLLYPMTEQMIEWNKNAVDAAKLAGVKHLVRSSGAGSDPEAGFLMPKVQGTIDAYIKDSGITYTITKPASFMQNFVNFLTNDIKNGAVYQPVRPDAKLNWVDVRDIAAVNAVILEQPYHFQNQEITISGSENLSYDEGLQIISKAIGRPIAFVTVPDEAAIDAMRSYQMSQFNIDMMMSLNHIINLGYAAMHTTAVKDITGKDPISFAQFVDEYKSIWM